MKFTAFNRSLQGTGASRRLRHQGRTPAIVFGGSQEPALIELDHNDLWHTVRKEAFHASILDMELNGEVHKVLLRNVQYHPFKPQVLHVDFQRVDEKTRLHKKVPLHFVGGEQSPAVKLDRCVINHVMSEIEIECLAIQLPEYLTVDLSQATKGTSIHVNQIAVPEGVKIVTHGHKDLTVATLVEPVEEVIAAPVAAAASDKKGKAKGKK